MSGGRSGSGAYCWHDQDHLAAALGLTFPAGAEYEKGVNRVGAGRLFELSEILSVSVTYFYEACLRGRGNVVHPGDRARRSCKRKKEFG
jgi:transcriptional regulator with XRE-family HTH domain